MLGKIKKLEDRVLPSERKEVTVSSETLAKYVGTYTINPYVGAYGLTPVKQLFISLENSYLMAQETNQPKTQLFSESETKFFGKIPDIQINFFNNKQGKISHFVLHQDGEDSTGVYDLSQKPTKTA